MRNREGNLHTLSRFGKWKLCNLGRLPAADRDRRRRWWRLRTALSSHAICHNPTRQLQAAVGPGSGSLRLRIKLGSGSGSGSDSGSGSGSGSGTSPGSRLRRGLTVVSSHCTAGLGAGDVGRVCHGGRGLVQSAAAVAGQAAAAAVQPGLVVVTRAHRQTRPVHRKQRQIACALTLG